MEYDLEFNTEYFAFLSHPLHRASDGNMKLSCPSGRKWNGWTMEAASHPL